MRNFGVKNFAALALSLLLLLGCSKNANPEKIADKFLEAYYTHANLDQSKLFASGLAQQKIGDQIALGGGQKGAGEESKRQVTFEKKDNIPGMEGDETATRKAMLFQINITGENTPEIHMLVRLIVEQVDGQWKVANFVES